MFGFVTLTTGHIITQWSEYLTMLTGLPPGEAVGRNLFQLFPDLKDRGIDTAIQHVIETGAPLSLSRILHRYIFTAKDGSTPEQSALIHPLTQANQVVGVILNIQDVSDRSQIEAELQNRVRLLEALREIDRLSMAGDLSGALQTAVDAASDLVWGQTVLLCLALDDERLRFTAHRAANPAMACQACGLCDELKRTKKPLRILTPANHPLVPAEFASAQALLIFPLLENDNYLGTMILKSDLSSHVMGDAPEILMSLSGAAARAMVDSRNRQAQQNRIAELEIIHSISSQLRGAVSRQEIVESGLKHAVQLVKGDGGIVLLQAAEPDEFRVEQAYRLPDEVFQMRPKVHGTFSGQAFETRSPVQVNDILKQYAEPQHIPEAMRAFLEKYPNWIFAPFIADNACLGVLGICKSAEHQFTRADQNLLTTITEIVAVALQRSIHLENAERRANQLAIMNDISQQLANVIKVDDAYSIVVNSLVERFHYALAAITEMDKKTGELVLRAVSVREGAHLNRADRLPGGSGITSAVLRDGRSQLNNHAAQDPRYLSISDLPPGSELCVPVLVDQDIAAAISIEQPFPNAFDTPDQDAVMTMAAHLGLAMSNIQRFERISQTAARLTIVERTMRQIAQNPTPATILQSLLKATREMVPFRRGGVFVIDEARQTIRAVEFTGVSADLERQLKEHPPRLSDGLFHMVYRSREPVEIEDTSADPRVMHFEGYTGTELSCYPLSTGERVMAVIDFDAIPPDDETRMFLKTLYDRGALALQNALLYEEMVNLAQQRAALLNLAVDLSAVSDERVLHHKVLESARLALDLDAAALGLLTADARGVQIVARESQIPGKDVCEVGGTLWLDQCPLMNQVIQKNTAAAAPVTQPGAVCTSLQEHFQKQGVQSLLYAPLVVNGRSIGLLMGYSRRNGRVFSDMDLTMAQGIANQAAIALRRPEFFDKQRGVEGSTIE